jgi:hypothetical protein
MVWGKNRLNSRESDRINAVLSAAGFNRRKLLALQHEKCGRSDG